MALFKKGKKGGEDEATLEIETEEVVGPDRNEKDQAEIDAKVVELERREATLLEKERAALKREEEVTLAEVGTFMDTLVSPASGTARVLPKYRPVIEAILKHITVQGDVFKIELNGKPVQAAVAFRVYLSELPVVVTYKELASNEDGPALMEQRGEVKAEMEAIARVMEEQKFSTASEALAFMERQEAAAQ